MTVGTVPVVPATRVRTVDDLHAHVAAALRTAPPQLVGAELEWLAVDRAAPLQRPGLDRLAGLLDPLLPLAGGAVITHEPGGQVELSSAAFPTLGALLAGLGSDLATVRRALAADGVVLRGLGTDPLRPPQRLLDAPRYVVMEDFFAAGDGVGALAGTAMMCCSAAVQVSVDAGTDGRGTQSAHERWQRAHAVGPALIAAFANSPLLGGARTGWSSTRQRFWTHIDPARTHPPEPGAGPVESTVALALGCCLMTVRDADGHPRPAPRRTTFADWIRDGEPTTDDLDYHLSTLFPPVRARGWFEVRYLDALPDPWWQVAVAVMTAVMDDDRAADAARAACAGVEGRWLEAARDGTGDPALARAAQATLVAAAEALPRLGAADVVPQVQAYLERWTSRGRCPADDLLDAHLAGVDPLHLLTGEDPSC